MILAIETSDILCSLAFWDEGRTILEYNLELPQQHATLVGSLTEQGLRFLAALERIKKYSREDIHLLVVGIGPGSFTGLRIGLSFAQGFCSAHQTSISGVSNHQILAAQRIKTIDQVYTIIEARSNEVYLAKHEIISGNYSRIQEHKIVLKSDLTDTLSAGAQLIYSIDLELDSEITGSLSAKGILIVDSARFSANHLAALGAEKMAAEGADDPAELEPMYIRPFAGAL